MKSEDMLKKVQQYIEGVSAQDMGAIRELYDEGAMVQDPVGSDPHVGIEAIAAFYKQGFNVNIQLELAGPVRCAGNSAAFPFVATTDFGGKKMRIDVIDVFEFNDSGRVQSMKAYWGPKNCTQG